MNLALGIDPGRDKTGFAFVNFRGDLLASGIFPTEHSEIFVKSLREFSWEEFARNNWLIEILQENFACDVKYIFVGNGTTSKDFVKNNFSGLLGKICEVDERNTTLEARDLYWKIHSNTGFFGRLLPKSIRIPPRKLDDLAAWAIAIRGLAALKNSGDMR